MLMIGCVYFISKMPACIYFKRFKTTQNMLDVRAFGKIVHQQAYFDLVLKFYEFFLWKTASPIYIMLLNPYGLYIDELFTINSCFGLSKKSNRNLVSISFLSIQIRLFIEKNPHP